MVKVLTWNWGIKLQPGEMDVLQKKEESLWSNPKDAINQDPASRKEFALKLATDIGARSFLSYRSHSADSTSSSITFVPEFRSIYPS